MNDWVEQHFNHLFKLINQPVLRIELNSRPNNNQDMFEKFYLELLATGWTQEIFSVRVAQHVQTEFVWTAEGFVTLHALEYLFWVEASHVLLNLLVLTRMIWHLQKKNVIKKIIYSVARLCKKK